MCPLGAKNKFDFVDGTILVPTHFYLSYKVWTPCNMLVHSWIMNYVEPSIAHSMEWLEEIFFSW